MAAAMASGVIFDQPSVFAVAKRFRASRRRCWQSPERRRHGQQRAGAETFAVRDVEEERGAWEVALDAIRETQFDAGQSATRGFQSERGALAGIVRLGRREDAGPGVDRGGIVEQGTPS